MGGMASAAGDDIRMGLTNKFESEDQERDYRARTKKTVAAQNALGYRKGAGDAERERQRQSAPARVSTISSFGIAPVGAAPDLPDPDAVGETEKALLDANKKGQSAMIATSPAGLLAGDDSTRKKRSLMGGLIR